MRFPRNLPVLAVDRTTEPLPAPVDAQFNSQDDANQGLSLMQVWSIVWAYRRQTIAIAVIILLITAVVTKLMPKTYTSTATLMVNYESNDPLAARGEIPTGPVATYISTEIELMQSSEVLLPVIDKLKLTADKYYISGYRGDGTELRDWVKDVLSKDLEVEQGRGAAN